MQRDEVRSESRQERETLFYITVVAVPRREAHHTGLNGGTVEQRSRCM